MRQTTNGLLYKRILSAVLALAVLLLALPAWSLTANSAEIMPLALTAAEEFAGGTGTENDPYRIETAGQLKLLADKVNARDTAYNSAYYELTADIDLGGEAWVPIGTSTNSFKGSFNGNGYMIIGLYINTDNHYQGLFGYVNGTVKNLGVKGNVTGGGIVGGVVGYNNGTIDNCSYTGNIIGTGDNVGGVVGNNNKTVQYCYNTGTVSGTQRVGGVVGNQNNTAGAIVQNCYNTGNVTVTGTGGVLYVGGVVGYNYTNGTVQDCYNTGNVTRIGTGGFLYAGGVVGYNYCSSDGTTLVQNCYNTGIVSGTGSNIGGVVGYNYRSAGSCIVKNCFFLNTVNDGLNGVGYNSTSGTVTNVVGINETSFALKATFTDKGWDFTTVWGMGESLEGISVRPILQANSEVHTHDGMTFTPWTSSDSLPTEAGSYYLTEDVEIDLLNGNSYGYWTAPAGEFNLCLNGYTITVNYTMKIGSGSDFKIFDCQSECGKILIDNSRLISEQLFYVLSGKLTVYNGKLESKNGSVINQANSDSVTAIEGGTISGSWCGIYVSNGKLTVNGGTVEGNRDYEYSCGIECDGAKAELTVNGGNISGAEEGLYMVEGTATVNGGTISGNGGDVSDGIWCNGEQDDSAEIIIKGGTVSGDRAGICIWGGTVKLSESPAISGAVVDIVLEYGSKITIDGTLKNSKPYSIQMDEVGVFTDSAETTYNDPDKFKASNVHSGYSVIKNADGQLELAVSAAHTHNGITFTPFTSGNNLPTEAGTYNLYLENSISLSSIWSIPAGVTVNLCLNGCDIICPLDVTSIKVGGELNIYDCQEKCGKVINNYNNPIWTDGSGGKITLYNGSIECNEGTASNHYCISVKSGGTLIVKGGRIYGKQRGVYSDGGTVIVEGGKVESGNQGIYSKNYVEISGGEVIGGNCGVFNDTSKGTMIVSDGAVIRGGEIGVSNKGTLTVTGGTITGNLYGIDISQSASAKTDISGGVIQGGKYGIYTKYATTLSGAPKITGDIADLYIMPASASNSLIITGRLSNETPYSVYMPNPGVFTKSTDTDLNVTDNFVPAQEHINNGYGIIKNSDGQLALTLKTYTVTYDSGEYGEGTIAPADKTHGASITLSSDTFTRTGYIQTGWATEDGGEKVYGFGDTYSDNADITLYPAWEECKHDSESQIWTDDKNDDGTHSRVCDDCGATVTKEHSFGKWTDNEDGKTHSKKCDDCGATITEEIPATGDNEDPSTGDNEENDAGNVNIGSESGENAPSVSMDKETSEKLKEEITNEHLTDEEKKAIENGDDLDVILKVEDASDTVSDEDKQAVDEAISGSEYTVGQYISIDLIKLINGIQVDKINELKSPIRITIEIPEALRGEHRVFAVVRVHGGETKLIEDIDDDPDTVTIETDKFSTYTLVYRNSEATEDNDPPYTGNTMPEIAVIVLACAVCTTAVAAKKKKAR